MTALFLAPHYDDESLFGAFTLQRHAPNIQVITVLRPAVADEHDVRRRETREALKMLGVTDHLEWGISDGSADWGGIEGLLTTIRISGVYDTIYAPQPYGEGGQRHHDELGWRSLRVFGNRPGIKIIHYHTYLHGGERPRGHHVPVEDPAWITRKLRALACYESQIENPETRIHFMAALEEWYA